MSVVFPGFQIKLLGQFSLSIDGTPIRGVKSERLQALLAFLLLHRDTPQSRQQIATHLWPDVSDTEAKANLRRRLHELKQKLPNSEHHLRVEQKEVQWVQSDDCWLDVAEFEAAIAQAQNSKENSCQVLEQAARFYQGDLLPSCYDDWIVPYRERLRQQAITVLDTLVPQLAEQNQVRAALSYAEQLRQIDPLYEPVYCHLMRLHAQEGSRAGALRVYHQCMTLLQEELGVPPSPSTCKLYENLLTLEDTSEELSCDVIAKPATPLIQDSSSQYTAIASLNRDSVSPLVGRETEWVMIQQWRTEGLKYAQPNLLCLVGEAGIGKTRLMEELARDIQTTGGYVIWGKGYEAEMLRPYGVWVDAFEGIGATEFLNELKTLLQDSSSQSSLNRERLFNTAVQFLIQLASTVPVLVVLDDIQWLDETSIAFCHYATRLLNQQAPVLFACTARTRELETNLPAHKLVQNLRREHRIQMLELKALDCSQTLKLARSAGYEIEDDQIFIKSGGNPLFILEIARAQEQHPNMTMGTLEGLIQDRLRQLSESAQELIPWAAALGHSFNPTILATVADCKLPRLLDAIDQLEQYSIIRPGNHIHGEMSYTFAHDIVRQVAYDQFSAPRRQLIHTHIAQSLNEIVSPTSPLIDDVAHHADLGSDHHLAARACLAAAQRCLRVFAYAEASELSQRGINHCQYLQTEDRVHFHLNLLNVFVKAIVPKKKVLEVQQSLEVLIQEANSLGLKDDEAAGLEALIDLNYDHGNLSAVHQQSLYAAEQNRQASSAKTMNLLAHTAACLTGICQEMSRAEALILEAQAIGERLGTQSIDIPFTLGCIRHYYGQSDEARVLLHDGWQLAKQAQDHWRECTCLTRLIKVELELRQLTDALKYCRELAHIAAQMKEGSEAAHAAALESLTLYLLQEQDATAMLTQACQELISIDSPRMLAYVQTVAAQWDLEQGNYRQAEARAEIALEAAQRVNNLSEIVLAESTLIRASYCCDNVDNVKRHQAAMTQRFNDPDLKHQTLCARTQRSMDQLEQAIIPIQTKCQPT